LDIDKKIIPGVSEYNLRLYNYYHEYLFGLFQYSLHNTTQRFRNICFLLQVEKVEKTQINISDINYVLPLSKYVQYSSEVTSNNLDELQTKLEHTLTYMSEELTAYGLKTKYKQNIMHLKLNFSSNMSFQIS
jgi:hypothetical protein